MKIRPLHHSRPSWHSPAAPIRIPTLQQAMKKPLTAALNRATWAQALAPKVALARRSW